MARSFLLTVYAWENIGFPHLADYFVFLAVDQVLTCRLTNNHPKGTEELNPQDHGRVTGDSRRSV